MALADRVAALLRESPWESSRAIARKLGVEHLDAIRALSELDRRKVLAERLFGIYVYALKGPTTL